MLRFCFFRKPDRFVCPPAPAGSYRAPRTNWMAKIRKTGTAAEPFHASVAAVFDL
jgi:hypothetical protein